MMLYDANKKSVGVGYLLWFFLGIFGAHRFYVGKTGTGVAMLILWCASALLAFVGIGIVGFIVLGIWALIDAFRLAGWIRDINTKLAQEMPA